MESVIYKSDDIRELRKKYASYHDTQKNILDKVVKENRNGLTDAEQRDFDGLTRKMDELGGVIAKLEDWTDREIGLSRIVTQMPSGTPTGSERTFRADEVRSLAPGERFVDNCTKRLPDNARADEFRIGRWLRGVVSGEWSGAEFERRVMMESNDTLGGYLLPQAVSSFFIDLARNDSALIQAGVRSIPFNTESLGVPTVLNDPTASWRAENSPISESDVNIGRVQVRARSLAAMCRVSNELLSDSADLAGQIIQNGLTKAMALEIDRAGLRGSGVGSEPSGILNWPGVNKANVGASVGFEHIIAAITRLSDANEDPNAYLMSTAVNGSLAVLKAGDGHYLEEPKMLTKYKRGVSNQIPASELYVGAFAQCAIMLRQSIEIRVAREAASTFEKNQTLIRAILRADFSVFRPAAFEVLTGIS